MTGGRGNRPALLIAAALVVVLVAFAWGYGPHRDELYFIAAGRHLDWAYADQGVVTPLIARAMTEIAPDSLTVLRLPSALMAGAVVFLTALLARDLGGERRAQWLAAACSAVATIVLFDGHLLSTSTVDLLVWTAVTWLAVRALRDDRLWLATGLVLGVGLMNKPLPAFLALGLLAGVAVAGPRRLLGNPYVWAGALIALVLWSPWILWQAAHDWPQLDVSRELASGRSASSEAWWAVVPFQFLLVSPPLGPVWIAGLVRLFRDPATRFLALAWIFLAVLFMATGGKPYYLAGLLPILLAAGAITVDGWLRRGRACVRAVLLGVALAGSAVVDTIIALPVLPARSAGPVVAVNEDVGETIGWPEFTRTVARVYRKLPDRAVIVAGNYGEAGAIDRYGPDLGLPRAYSGHNAYYDWGRPPEGSRPVVAIGLNPRELALMGPCRAGATIDSGAGLDNEEDGKPVMVCRGPNRPWAEVWPALRRLG